MIDRYTVRFTTKSEKDIKKLSSPVQKRVLKKISQLETNRKPAQLKLLIGIKITKYRLRIGDYRILFDIYEQDKAILILRIGHRKDVYR